MRKYSSLSWKRTWCWSNSPLISALDLGALTKSEKAGSQTTTTRYRDAQGRAKFKGNKRLKASQYLIWICWTDKKHMGDISLFIVSTPVAARQAIYLQICWETCQHGSPIPCRKDSTSDWGRDVQGLPLHRNPLGDVTSLLWHTAGFATNLIKNEVWSNDCFDWNWGNLSMYMRLVDDHIIW